MSGDDSDGSKVEEGIAFRYPPHGRRLLPVAPSTDDDTRFNAIVLEGWPRPTACVRLDPERFPFDSSFPHATVSHDLARLFEIRPPEDTAGDKLAVFGHADPTGSDEYNKTLSGRRAKAVYALLTRQPKLWDELHQQRFEGDTWGIESLQLCLAELGFDPGPVGPKASPSLRVATETFQIAHNLESTGQTDRVTRIAIFGAYMDKLLGGTTAAPRAFAEVDFVGQGKERDLRGAFQGCGKRNPAMIISAEQDRELKKAENHPQRNRVQAVNRRALIFTYSPKDVKNMKRWKCPAASAPMSACDPFKWSDMDERLKPAAKRREIRRKGKTFGCTFYDFTARLSPCEAIRGSVKIFLRDEKGQKFPKPVDYEVRSFNTVRKGTTDSNGALEEVNIPIERSMVVSWLNREKSAPVTSSPKETAQASDQPQAGASDDSGDDEANPSDNEEGSSAETESESGETVDGEGEARELASAQAPASAIRDAKTGTSPDNKTRSAAAAPANSAPSGATRSTFVHHGRVFLPLVDEKDKDRRDLLWLQNLGFAVEPGTFRKSMAALALEYGLAQNAPAADQSGLLEQIQATGREAKGATVSDTPTPDPAAGAAVDDATATVTQRPACRCENAPNPQYSPTTSTFVSPVPQFINFPKQTLLNLPADLLFEMPLLTGKFLFKDVMGSSGASSGTRPIRDPATKLHVRDHQDPKLGKQTSGTVSGICPEMAERLKWAEQRMWFFYCRETTQKGGQTSDKGFAAFVVTHGISPHGSHGTMRSGSSMHSDGAAIDVGTGNSPFICVRKTDGTIVGEKHDSPSLADLIPKGDKATGDAFTNAVGSFYPDNAFEPAVAAFDRAMLLAQNRKADLSPAVGEFPKARPQKSPCEETSDHTPYAEAILKTYDNFDEVNEAWKAYVKPETMAQFKADVIDIAKLNGSLAIDSDLVSFAEKSNDPPPTFSRTPIETVQVGNSPIRRRRKRIDVSIDDIKKKPERLRAAFFQMLRDQELMHMAMVSGKLSGFPSSKPMATGLDPKRNVIEIERRIPCAWPDNAEISIPFTSPRDVRKGFMGVSRLVTRVLVEAGLTWLGGTGNGKFSQEPGSPISDFTGDIMHFDLRRLDKVGSSELDQWFVDNEKRQAWKGIISEVFQRVVSGIPGKLKTKDGPASPPVLAIRPQLSKGFGACEDPAGLVKQLDDAKVLVAPNTPTPDPPLVALIESVIAELTTLGAARSRKRSDFAAKVEPIFKASDQALSAAYFSQTQVDAETALSTVKGLVIPTLDAPDGFVTPYNEAFKGAKELVKDLVDLANNVAKSKKATTKNQRDSSNARADALREKDEKLPS